MPRTAVNQAILAFLAFALCFLQRSCSCRHRRSTATIATRILIDTGIPDGIIILMTKLCSSTSLERSRKQMPWRTLRTVVRRRCEQCVRFVFIRRRHLIKENQVSGVKNSAGDLHTLLSTAPGSRRADVKVAASARSRSGDDERYQLTGNRRLLYSTYTQTTGCADNKELRWNAPR